MLVLKDPKEEQ